MNSTSTSLDSTPAPQGDQFSAELTELLNSLNRAGPGSRVVPSEYLEAVVTLR